MEDFKNGGSMTKVKPLGKRILVQRSKAALTKGGIYLPEAAQEKPKQGEVIAVGPEEMEITIGDIVLFGSFAGTEVKGDEENEYLVLKEEDVLAIVE